MVNSMVERATSDMLIGPDWATNIEICDMLNRDPGQAKDVVRGIKRRLGSRNSKVQLLSLTLLETIIKNCGDIVHMHVAEKDVLHEMVKIIKKKPDFHVKEKILILIDTWQEAFGGPMARYPQYNAAYQELLRAGAVFPQRSERSAPIFTPPQTQPLTSYPPNLRYQDVRPETGESSVEAEFPALSLMEIQNAREIMDVLAEMLNAIDPLKGEGVKQEVIVDLVEQCRTYKQRVLHLVNSTSDESLLCDGLALNDDLQKLLAKHEAMASGTYVPEEDTKHKPPQPLAVVAAPLVDTGRSASASIPPPQPPSVAAPANVDLLSGDDYNSPTANTSLALVPVGDSQPKSPISDQNAIVLFDMFPQANVSSPQPDAQSNQTYPTPLQITTTHNTQADQPVFNQSAGTLPQNITQQPYAHGSNMILQQQPASTSYDALPPPPWEAPSNLQASQILAQPPPNGSYAQGYPQVVGGMYTQPTPAFNPTNFQGHQFSGLQPQPQFPVLPPQLYAAGYYGYAPREQNHFIEQRMNGLSLRDDSYLGRSYPQPSVPSYVKNTPRPSRSEDKLFGDLVDMARVKPAKPPADRSGSK